MRILTYCDEDIGVAAGGSRQVLEFAKALALRGHEVTLVAPQSEREGAALTASIQVQAAFVPVARWGGLRPLSFFWGSMRLLKQLLRARPPEVLLWFDSPGQMAPLWALRNSTCPVVYFVNGLPLEEVQGPWLHPPLREWLTHGLRLASRKANALVSVCPEVLVGLRNLEPVDATRCSVIRNGVDPDHFFPQPQEKIRAELGLTTQGPYIAFVGGFFPWHGLDTLVEAIAFVVKSFPTVQCLLVGDGQTKKNLEEQVQQLQLSPHVLFTGRVDFDMVPKWIAASDVCVVLHRQTRSYPGDSMKLWEYLACGRPVVATAGPGYGDTVEELRCGLSAKADDPADLARQLLCLLVDQDLRRSMGKRGRMAVARSHTWTARAGQLEQVCRQAIVGTKSAA
ncbi:MAG TPA: glycosyltransferase family 4 protein [Nitrospira sp.]|nr:glycosyltransferase family 4 protein [Nitrospira sp.]